MREILSLDFAPGLHWPNSTDTFEILSSLRFKVVVGFPLPNVYGKRFEHCILRVDMNPFFEAQLIDRILQA